MKLGLQEKSGGSGIFLVVKHDCICQESKVEKPGFEPREVRNPQTDETSIKFIKPYGSVAAMITKIEWRDTGEQYDQRYTSWRIHLDMGDEGKAVMELPYQSRASSRFMKLAENIDFSRPVELRAWYDAKGKSTAFFVGQWENEDDEKSISVPQKYTRDNPGACPEPVQRLGGKWSFDDQTEFLHSRMMTVVIPAVDAANRNGHEPSAGVENEPEPTMDRDGLLAKIRSLCTQLNAAGDEPKWASSRLAAYVNETYQVEDGLNSLSPDYLAKLINLLDRRLTEMEGPF